jgi:hypothetical protein
MFFNVLRIGAGIAGAGVAGYGSHMVFEKVFEGVTHTTVEKGIRYVTEASIAAAAGKEAYRICSFGRNMEDDEEMMEIKLRENWNNLMNKKK